MHYALRTLDILCIKLDKLKISPIEGLTEVMGAGWVSDTRQIIEEASHKHSSMKKIYEVATKITEGWLKVRGEDEEELEYEKDYQRIDKMNF